MGPTCRPGAGILEQIPRLTPVPNTGRLALDTPTPGLKGANGFLLQIHDNIKKREEMVKQGAAQERINILEPFRTIEDRTRCGHRDFPILWIQASISTESCHDGPLIDQLMSLYAGRGGKQWATSLWSTTQSLPLLGFGKVLRAHLPKSLC
jgi:hypothetical protein